MSTATPTSMAEIRQRMLKMAQEYVARSDPENDNHSEVRMKPIAWKDDSSGKLNAKYWDEQCAIAEIEWTGHCKGKEWNDKPIMTGGLATLDDLSIAAKNVSGDDMDRWAAFSEAFQRVLEYYNKAVFQETTKVAPAPYGGLESWKESRYEWYKIVTGRFVTQFFRTEPLTVHLEVDAQEEYFSGVSQTNATHSMPASISDPFKTGVTWNENTVKSIGLSNPKPASLYDHSVSASQGSGTFGSLPGNSQVSAPLGATAGGSTTAPSLVPTGNVDDELNPSSIAPSQGTEASK